MTVLYRNHPHALTTTEIADALMAKRANIRKAMCISHKQQYHYFKRHPREKGENAYRYTLTDKGLEYFVKYHHRIMRGYSLNLREKVPKRMSHYTNGGYDKHRDNPRVRELTEKEFWSYMKQKLPPKQ